MTFEKFLQEFKAHGLKNDDVRRYLEAGGDSNQRDPETGWTIAHLAARAANPAIIRLLAPYRANLNAVDNEGRTPLHLAVDSDLDPSDNLGQQVVDMPTVTALIELGADENLRGKDGLTARDIARARDQGVLYEKVVTRAGKRRDLNTSALSMTQNAPEIELVEQDVLPVIPVKWEPVPEKKTNKAVIVAVLVAAVILLLILPFTRDELSWSWARLRNTSKSYDAYLASWSQGRHLADANARKDELSWATASALQTFTGYIQYVQSQPAGKHLAEAQARMETILWQLAVSGNTVAGYQDFMARYPASASVPEARTRIEEVVWQQARAANTIRGFQAYLASYPQGKHAAEAASLQQGLRSDAKPLTAALNAQSEKALQDFLKNYPGHGQEAAARQALKDLKEGRDVADLIADKKIEAYALGNGTSSIQIKMKKLVPGALTVRIPIGTYFASDYNTVQNMVAMEERRITLDSEFWMETTMEAASMNFSKDAPDFEDTFKFRQLPDQSPAAPLLPVLEKSGTPFPVWQAALWIVTDNVTYDNMGALATHPGDYLLENIRVIKEPDAAQAMKLCDDAGVDIVHKKIWKKSRAQILQGLSDSALISWMQSKPAQ